MLKDDLLTGGAEIAAYLGVNERAGWHMIQTGVIPVIRKGRRIFARKSELDASFTAAA